MGNMILGVIICAMITLLVLIAIVVVCCLYVGIEADKKLRILFNEYIKEKKF